MTAHISGFLIGGRSKSEAILRSPRTDSICASSVSSAASRSSGVLGKGESEKCERFSTCADRVVVACQTLALQNLQAVDLCLIKSRTRVDEEKIEFAFRLFEGATQEIALGGFQVKRKGQIIKFRPGVFRRSAIPSLK